MKNPTTIILASMLLVYRRMLVFSFCLGCPPCQKTFKQVAWGQRVTDIRDNNDIFAAMVQRIDVKHKLARNDDEYVQTKSNNNGVNSDNEYNGGNLSGQRRPETQNEEEVEEPYFDSLDIVLERARKRKMVMLPIQIQAISGKTVIKLGLGDPRSNKSYLTVGDCALILVALKLGSVGFSIGYVIGKASSPILRSSAVVPIMVVELWAGGLAVFSDIVWNNVF